MLDISDSLNNINFNYILYNSSVAVDIPYCHMKCSLAGSDWFQSELRAVFAARH